MIYGIGTDVVEVIRIKESIEKYGDKLAKKILTDEELIAYKSSTLKENFLAKKFSFKVEDLYAINSSSVKIFFANLSPYFSIDSLMRITSTTSVPMP